MGSYRVDSGVPFLVDDLSGRIIGYVDNRGQEVLFNSGSYPMQSRADAAAAYPRFPKLSEKLDKVRAGQDSLRIVTVCDSTGVAVGNNGGWSDQLTYMLTTSGRMPACNNSRMGLNIADTRLVKGSSFTADATITSIGGSTWKASTNTNSLAWTPDQPTDRCRVWYVKKPGNGVLSIDYSGLGTATQDTNAAAGVGYYELNAGGLANWTYNVKWSSGGQINIIGFECWDSSRTMVRMITGALGGTTSSDWVGDGSAWSWQNALVAMGADLYILAPGINETASSLSLTTFANNLTSLTTALTAVGDIYYATGLPQNPNDTGGSHFDSLAKQQTYADVVRTHCIAYNIPNLDINVHWGTFDLANAKGYEGDNWVHPSATGYSNMARLHGEFIFGNSGFGRGLSSTTFGNLFDSYAGYAVKGGTVLGRAGTGSTIVGVTNALGTAATSCTVVGDNAGALLSTAQNTTIVGYGAMSTGSLSGKINNTAVGYECMKACTGNNNTAFGLQAGLILAGGTDNTIIGYKVGSTVLTTGSRNILIGNSNAVTTPAAGTNDFLNIGNLITGDLSSNFNLSLLNGAATAGSFGGGIKVMFISNATTIPSSNPTGGGIIYVEAGALKYRGSSGTITTIGAA